MPEQFSPAWEYFCPSEEIDDEPQPRDFNCIFDSYRDQSATRAERRANLGFRFGKGNPDKFLPFRLGRPKRGRVVNEPEAKRCLHCGAVFVPKRKQRKYCGKSCARKHEWAWLRRTVSPKVPKEPKKRTYASRIDPTVFAEMFLAGCRMRDIAGRFGVQVNQCKKLRRKLGLPGRPRGRPSQN